MIGTVGSAIGAIIDYYLGALAFLLLDSKFAINQRVEYAKKRFPRVANYGFPGLLIVGRLLPFAVLKPVMIAAGAIRYDKRIYIAIIVLASFVRYFFAAEIGSLLHVWIH
jgi:membrane protein YqaA with SNARE-associated domain